MKNSLRVISTLSLIVGVLGMAGGFIYLSAVDMADIVAGTSGFLAGSVLFGCSLIALAILAKDE